MQFAASVLPLSGSQPTQTFANFSISKTIGARFHYVTVPPERPVLSLLPRVIGQFMYELSPWDGERQSQPNRLGEVFALREIEREGAYFIDLDRTKLNVLVVGDLNENLVDGSVVWLNTLVSALAAYPHMVVYVATNTILIPNSNTAELFSRPNIVKVDLDGVGAGQGAKLGTEAARLDRISGGFDFVIVRGIEAAKSLDTKYLCDRLVLYSVGLISPENVEDGKLVHTGLLSRARRTTGLIFQSETTRDIFARSAPDYRGGLHVVPPSVDPLVLKRAADIELEAPRGELVVYSGKLIREYGLLDLLDVAARLIAARPAFRLILLGNKFDGRDPEFQTEFHRRLDALGGRVEWMSAVPQSEVLAWVKAARAVWGWRHGEFETAHFETSTKMIEAIVSGVPIVLYPSDANVALLGGDYRGFARTPEEAGDALIELVDRGDPAFEHRRPALAERFTAERAYAPLAAALTAAWRARRPATVRKPHPTLLVASHDFRFFEDMEGIFLDRGVPVRREFWKSHTARHIFGADPEVPDVVFCDWCLGNAVWWSNNLPRGSRLVVRLHLQELLTEHPHHVDFSQVHRVVFVSPHIMREAQAKFGIPSEICRVIPISVGLDPSRAGAIEPMQRRDVLGIVGITPWRKRLDKAVELLLALRERHPAVRLLIKEACRRNTPGWPTGSKNCATTRTCFGALPRSNGRGPWSTVVTMRRWKTSTPALGGCCRSATSKGATPPWRRGE